MTFLSRRSVIIACITTVVFAVAIAVTVSLHYRRLKQRGIEAQEYSIFMQALGRGLLLAIDDDAVLWLSDLRENGAEECFQLALTGLAKDPGRYSFDIAKYGPSSIRIAGESDVSVDGRLRPILACTHVHHRGTSHAGYNVLLANGFVPYYLEGQ